MKCAVLIFLLVFSSGVLAQKPTSKTPVRKTPAVRTKPKASTQTAAVRPKPSATPLSEKEQFEKASAHELAVDRIAGLEAFVTAFPQSEYRPQAADLLASSRALIAEEKLLL